MQSRKFKPIHPSLLKAKKLNEKDFEKRGGDALELEQLSLKEVYKEKTSWSYLVTLFNWILSFLQEKKKHRKANNMIDYAYELYK